MKWPITFAKTSPAKVLALTAAASLLIGAWRWYAVAARGPDQGNTGKAVTITRGTIEELVTSQGKLEAKQYVDVGAQVSGQLKKIYVEIGNSVNKGQLVAEIDPRVFEAQVEASEAHLNSLRAQLNQQKAAAVLAEQNLKRNQTLIAANAVSQQALQESQSQAAVAKAQVDASAAQIQETESNLKGIRTNLGFTKIYAPIAGTVTTMPAREGQTLNANQSAPTILQVANLDVMTVRAQVAEADVTRLKEGMPAYFTTLGNVDRRWQGKVRQIQPSPEVVNDVVLYDVLIDVNNEDHKLMTGMTTQVFFVLGRAENATIVPAEALTRTVPELDTSAGKAYRVTLLTDQGSQSRVIHVGLQTRTQGQVVDGLQPGDRIVVGRQRSAQTAQANTQRPNNAPRFNRGPQI